MYKPISLAELPDGLIFHTPRQNQGQIVEVSYSSGRPGDRSEAGPGDTYKRVVDHSDGTTDYYRRSGRR